jgi:pimeloyl-ACP methyl ester carboxylesterase
MVHGDDVNRLQFGEATAVLYKYLVALGFNVLSFDLRHSGDSSGRLTTYGYTEWEDVLAAVDYARRTTTTRGVVLYGFGNGTGAALAAWQELPTTEENRTESSSLVVPLPITKDYILAMMLDSPRNSLDDSIRSAMDRLDLLSVFPLPYTVPLAVRLSAGSSGEYPLSALAARYQRPMLIMEARTEDGERTTLLRERLRLHPETTSLFERAIPGGETLFEADPTDYLSSISNFLDLCFP